MHLVSPRRTSVVLAQRTGSADFSDDISSVPWAFGNTATTAVRINSWANAAEVEENQVRHAVTLTSWASHCVRTFLHLSSSFRGGVVHVSYE
ncbi:hypothetical protein C8Q77DRAFT_221734 [Trametes polyzona]|nr:hypothetical protein C8Q77DRAFT_221734 [Trametes polyzona]